MCNMHEALFGMNREVIGESSPSQYSFYPQFRLGFLDLLKKSIYVYKNTMSNTDAKDFESRICLIFLI